MVFMYLFNITATKLDFFPILSVKNKALSNKFPSFKHTYPALIHRSAYIYMLTKFAVLQSHDLH